MIRIVVIFLTLAALYPASAQMSIPPAGAPAVETSPARVVEQVRAYRRAHEHAIIHEFTDLLSIPNVATDTANIRRNAAKIVEMVERRGFRTRLLEIPGRGPVIYAELASPGAAHTLLVYAHYDGQPVDAKAWIGSLPFQPVLRTKSIDASG